MQQHDVKIALWTQLASAITTDGDQADARSVSEAFGEQLLQPLVGSPRIGPTEYGANEAAIGKKFFAIDLR